MPLVYSVDGIAGRETKAVEKCQVSYLTKKRRRNYSEIVCYVRARLALLVVRANSLLIWGSRGHQKPRHPLISDRSVMINWQVRIRCPMHPPALCHHISHIKHTSKSIYWQFWFFVGTDKLPVWIANYITGPQLKWQSTLRRETTVDNLSNKLINVKICVLMYSFLSMQTLALIWFGWT